MAESVTITGLKEMQEGVKQLDALVTAKLRAVAWRTSRTVKDGARVRLLARRKAIRTAESITIVEEASKNLFRIEVPGDPTRPPMLPWWLELGTIYMSGAYFLTHALQSESPQYVKEMEAAAIDGAKEALG